MSTPPALPPVISDWFASKGWQPRRHQLEMLDAARAGQHAVLVAPTGAGKTLAGFLASLTELTEAPSDGLHTLYVSPLKALAVDVHLRAPGLQAGLELAPDPVAVGVAVADKGFFAHGTPRSSIPPGQE